MILLIRLLLPVTILILLSAATMADTIEIEYSFPAPQIEIIKIDGQLFDRVTIPECPGTGPIGQPELPYKRTRILMPYGHEVKSVAVTTSERLLVASGLRLNPVEAPIAMSTPPERIPPLTIDEIIYGRMQPLPDEKLRRTSVQTYHGCRIALYNLCPVEYVPSTGDLYYYPSITLSLETVETSQAPAVRGLAQDLASVARRVDNPAQVVSYGGGDRGDRAYDLLVITSAAMADAFQPLKDYHDLNGVSTEIHTLDQIGANDPHSVRDYIRQEYMTNGIRLVLLGGDDNTIPALDLYVAVTHSSGTLTEYDVPGDFYFACLDGTFNYDGDSYYGEPGDGESGGEIDLLPEVGLGRVPADNAAEVSNIVNKTLAYLDSDATYLSKVLISGEDLGFGGLGEYGGYAMEEMVGGSDAHGFTTCGFPADQYEIDKLYDLYSLPYNWWNPSELISRINDGVHIVDHLGHSDVGYAMRTDTTMIREQLSNTDYCFLYAEGCNAGMFDRYDCWAEYVTVKLAAGAFGCVANSRIGMGSRSTKHPVHVMNREFWDAVYSADEGHSELGMAMADARFDLAARIDVPAMRWTYYETNLFADPAIAIKPVRSLAIMFPDGVPSCLPPLSDTSFDITVTGIGEGAVLPSSGLLHYSIDGGDFSTTPILSVRQDLFQAVLPGAQCGEVVDYYVTFEETVGGICYAPDPADAFRARPVSEEVVVFEDDFESDQGWSISGGLWARGIPLGLGGDEQNYPVPDPTEGCLGPSVMGYNLSGNYENSLPARHVTSPAIDCSDASDTRLRYCRWLGVEQPGYDQALVSISTDGDNWITLWQNYAIIADLEWNDIEYDISAYADGEPTVYLRWTMGPTDGGLRFIGWNLDNVRVISLYCQSFVCGDIDGNDTGPDIGDLVYLAGYMFQDGPVPPVIEACDVDGNGAGPDIADLVYLATYMFQDGPPLQCL